MPGLEAPPTIYRSKRDRWIIVVLWGANLVMLLSALRVWSSEEGLISRLGFAATMLAVTALVVWILESTRYELGASELVIRSGPFRWTIPLASIREVAPTNNPLSSPALSLDRLLIRYPGRSLGIMISPEDKEGFLRELVLRSPGLVLEGGRLVRRS